MTTAHGVAAEAGDPWIVDGVREKRGADAGCRTPSTSTNALRAALCG